MAVQRTDHYIEYTVTQDGEKRSFPYAFPTKSLDYIAVVDKTEEQSRYLERTEYQVQAAMGGLDNGGTVTLAEDAEAGHIIRIERQTPRTQLKTFGNQNRIRPEEIEDALDRTTMLIHELTVDTSGIYRDIAGEGDKREEGDAQVLSTLQSALASETAERKAEAAEEKMFREQGDANEKAAREEADGILQAQITTVTAALATKADNGHKHTIPDTDGLQAALDGKAPTEHQHSMDDVTGLQSALAGKQEAGEYAEKDHAHDQYATKEDLEEVSVDVPVATYSTPGIVRPDGVTVHIEADGTLSAVGGGTSGEGGGTSVHNELTGRNVPDAHPISAVTGLQDALNGKQEAGSYSVTGHSHVISDVSDLQAALSGKQDAGDYAAAEHTHTQYAEAGELTALEQTVQAITDGDITTTPADHTHAIADVETLQDTLDGKAASTHTHQQSEIDGLADALANAGGGIAEAPEDGNYYARRSKVWAEIKRKFVCFHPDGGPVFYKYKSSSTASTARVRVRAGSIINGYEYTSYSSLPAITVSDTSNQGQDFGIFYRNGSFYVKQDNKEDPASETTWGKRIGGFHVGLVPYDATLASAGCNTATSSPLVSMVWTQADLDLVKDINEYSIWDLSYRPKCDPRGMVCVRDGNGKGNFWVDIYFLNNNYYNKGTSRANQPMASGAVLPPRAKIAGGNGTALYTTLNWYEANEIAFDQNKRLMTYDEFCVAAFGVTENQSLGGSGTPEQTKHENGYMSKWGIEQATGHIFTWGRTAHGVSLADANVANAWQENIATRGQVYNKPCAVLFGGSRSFAALSGSRCGNWSDVPSASNWQIGARLACDHLTLGA